MTKPNRHLTAFESRFTPCPYNRLWLVQIPEDGWDRFKCIVDDSGLRSPELSGPLEAPENGVEFVRKESANYTTEQLQAAYDRAYADVRKEYAEDLPKILADAGAKTVEELAVRYRDLCTKIVFGQIDGATIAKAEEVLQKWNGDE
jgi:hypothetical protein